MSLEQNGQAQVGVLSRENKGLRDLDAEPNDLVVLLGLSFPSYT